MQSRLSRQSFLQSKTSHHLAERHGGKAEFGFYDRLFFKHISLKFGEDLELAFRASFFVLVCGLPFMIPEWLCPVCGRIVKTGFYSSGSVTYFMFTLYKTTGDTIHFAIGGLAGTLIAVFNIWCMMGFMPGGYMGPDSPDQWVWYVGMAWGMLFVFFMLWLNFDGNTQVFGLSTYVWYWMAFLNYHTPFGFSHSFTISHSGAAVRELLVAASGISLALIAAFIPYPMFAIWKAQRRAKDSLWELHILWTEFNHYYTGKARNPYKVTILRKKLDVMKGNVGQLNSEISAAWYECLGMGPWQRQRMMLKILDGYLAESFNRLSTVLHLALDEEFEGNHQKLMTKVEPQMTKLVLQTGHLLAHCVDTVACGDNKKYKAAMDTEVDELISSREELTTEFIKACQSVGHYMVSEECSGQHVVCSNICSFSRLTREFARKLQRDMPSERVDWRDGGGMFGLFAPALLVDRMHLNYVLRNWLSICLSFWVGYKGVAGKMVLPYNAALASTCCVLLSRFIGSAMSKNLNRLQGVVLGTVFGQVVYALLAWCIWWGYLAIAVAVFIWAFASLFIYYNSQTFSSVGLLLGVFGVGGMLQGCSDEIFDPTLSYYGVINCTSGIVIMCLVDTIFAAGRASDLALMSFHAAWDPILQQVDELLNYKMERLAPRRGTVRGLIADAHMLCQEAEAEPRYWRHPWPLAAFERGVKTLSMLRFTLAALEAGVTQVKPTGEAVKEEHFIAATKMESFIVVADHLKDMLKKTKNNLTFLLKNETGITSQAMFMEMKSLTDSMEQTSRDQLDVFAADINAQKHESAKDTLENDPISDMSILTRSLQSIFDELAMANRQMLALV